MVLGQASTETQTGEGEMAKALIARFSQTGTTDRVAERIAAGLRSAGWEADLWEIAQDGTPDLAGYELLGIGTPTYFFRPPFVTTDFVRSLPDLSGVASFVFVLYGTLPGDCGNWLREELRAKGARDLGYLSATGADRWVGYVKRGYLFSPDGPTEAELAAAEGFGRTLAGRYRAQAPDVEPFDRPTPFMYRLERFLVNRTQAKLMYSKTFRADGNCNACGQCIALCPVNNITTKADGRPKWHSDCLLCATCELGCPHDAVHAAFDWPIFAPFMSYNIRHALQRATPYVRVEHSRGKTRRV
jgi:flavodoxin/ferredoxin